VRFLYQLRIYELNTLQIDLLLTHANHGNIETIEKQTENLPE
jgi:hypothetical protein